MKYHVILVCVFGLATTLAANYQQNATAIPCPVSPAPTGKIVSRPPTSQYKLLPQPKGTLPRGVAALSARVDLNNPIFSNPTNITNPLFPVAKVSKALLLGRVGGLPFHVEYTLMPRTRTIKWNGQAVETLEVQYAAQLGGRVTEMALDWYAQADDGSVWYFGEDVFDYENGVIISTDGTWLAGRDGIPAMIMPAKPKVGNVYRVENIPGVAWEEITVKAINQTVNGPRGQVSDAMIGLELHMNGTYSNKTFAPNYGEFVTIRGSELEALALAIPTDALECSVPAELETLSNGADEVYNALQAGIWSNISSSMTAMITAWDTYQAGKVPGMLDAQMSTALVELTAAVNAHQPSEARQAVMNLSHANLDLQLPHRPLSDIELERGALYARQLLLDACDLGAIRSDVTNLEWLWKRVQHTININEARVIEPHIRELRVAVDSKKTSNIPTQAAALRKVFLKLSSTRR